MDDVDDEEVDEEKDADDADAFSTVVVEDCEGVRSGTARREGEERLFEEAPLLTPIGTRRFACANARSTASSWDLEEHTETMERSLDRIRRRRRGMAEGIRVGAVGEPSKRICGGRGIIQSEKRSDKEERVGGEVNIRNKVRPIIHSKE